MSVLDRVNPFPFRPIGEVLEYPIEADSWDGGRLAEELSHDYVFWECSDEVKNRIDFFNCVLNRLAKLRKMPNWYDENEGRFVLDRLKEDEHFKRFTIQGKWLIEGKFNFNGLHGEGFDNYSTWNKKDGSCPLCYHKSNQPLRISYLNERLRKAKGLSPESKETFIGKLFSKIKEEKPSFVQLLRYAFPALVVSKLALAILRKAHFVPFEKLRGRIEGMIPLRKAFILWASTLLFLNFFGVNISMKKE